MASPANAMDASADPKFPCALQASPPPVPVSSYPSIENLLTSVPSSRELHVPFPTSRLASVALKALQVDPELSPLVLRHLSVFAAADASSPEDAPILKVEYQATTNRMLRVAVNSFMEGLRLVLEVMEQLDVDVLAAENQKPIKSP